MLNSYQILALKIRRNFYEGKKLENCSLLTLSIPILSAKNLKEKFAKLFLTEIQKNRLPKTPIFSLPPLIQTKVGAEISGEKWRYFYKEFHLFLAQKRGVTTNFIFHKNYRKQVYDS